MFHASPSLSLPTGAPAAKGAQVASQGRPPTVKRRGMTLVELIIAAALALMILGMVWAFLVPSMRFTAEGTATVELQQQAILALNRIISDLQQTPATGVSISTAPPAVAVNRIEQIDASGAPQYEDNLRVYWYDAATQRLMFEEYPPAPPALGLTFIPSKPIKVTGLDLQQIANQSNNQERFLAGSVQSFSVVFDAGGVLILNIQMDKEIPHTERRAQVQMTRRILLRNT